MVVVPRWNTWRSLDTFSSGTRWRRGAAIRWRGASLAHPLAVVWAWHWRSPFIHGHRTTPKGWSARLVHPAPGPRWRGEATSGDATLAWGGNVVSLPPCCGSGNRSPTHNKAHGRRQRQAMCDGNEGVRRHYFFFLRCGLFRSHYTCLTWKGSWADWNLWIDETLSGLKLEQEFNIIGGILVSLCPQIPRKSAFVNSV